MTAGPLVLIHVPKTAGTTFGAIVRRNHPLTSLQVPNAFRHVADMHARLTRIRESPPGTVRFAHGHVPLTVFRDALPGATFVSFLREPVARTWSHYRHLVPPDGQPLDEALTAHDLLYDNLQVRLLCGLPDPLTRPADDELYEAALRELRSLAYYGLVERFDESLVLARQALGLRTIAYRRENVRGGGRGVPDEHLDALRAHNHLDLLLYERACADLAPLLGAQPRAVVRALRESADALTAGRPPRSPRALGFAASYVAARTAGPLARRGQRWRQWRRWRSVRALRGGLRVARLRR